MLKKLEALESDFKIHHLSLIDLIDDDETIEKEDDVMGQMDEDILHLVVRLQQMIATCSSPSGTRAATSPRDIASCRLQHVQRSISSMQDAISTLTDRSEDVHLLRHYEEQLSDLKKEAGDIRNMLVPMDLGEGDEPSVTLVRVETGISECSISIKKLLCHRTRTSHDPLPDRSDRLDGKGVKLPKLDVPTFDGDILNWLPFWEQFHVAVDSRTNLSNTEKLVYLQQSLKEGPGKRVIEGLSQSGVNYAEAVESLKSHFDRPHLVHQTHVRMILEVPPLRDGNGKELRRLHDVVQQHLRALKAMEYEPSGHFITSALELKLDVDTMFEWQKHSQSSTKVPHYRDILSFINLRAQEL